VIPFVVFRLNGPGTDRIVNVPKVKNGLTVGTASQYEYRQYDNDASGFQATDIAIVQGFCSLG